MKAKYDEVEITITKEFKAALIQLMKAECAMMSKNDSDGGEFWYWGRATINDLSAANGIDFEYGGRDDKPHDDLGRFAVVVA